MNTQILTDKIRNDDLLNNLASYFQNEIYLVGGSVRDTILNKPITDRDLIVIDEDAKKFSQKVAEFFGATFITLDEKNKIYRVVMPDKTNYFDITNPQENSLEKDILRRDLTINAIAINIKTGEIPSFCKTYLKDLENKIIKGIEEKNFTDDPLRLLRIFRFHSILGFDIEKNLLKTVKKYAHLIQKPAKERIHYELMKLFSGEHTHETLLKMDECELLEVLFPIIKELKQVPPNLHHHLNLFYHSIETVKQVEQLYKQAKPEIKTHLERVDFGGFSRLSYLKLATFLHDIGKFSTWTIEESPQRHRFIKHDDVGAKMSIPLLKKLCFSNKEIDYISYIIKKHIYPSSVVSAPDINEKTLMRYVRKSEDYAIDNIIIAQADRLSARGPEITEEIVNNNISALNNLLEFYLRIRDTLKPLPKLLNGNEVMKILDINQSPMLGEIINAITEAQISGEISTKEEAVEFILNNYHQN